MLTFFVDENTEQGRSLLAFVKKLKAPAKAIRLKRETLTDENMALPGYKPTDKELDAWLNLPDTDEGSDAETVRKRLLTRLRKSTSRKK